jgi:hypothetical protein
MPDRGEARPPVAYRWLIRVASWTVPGYARPAWYARWDSNLRSLWILSERGELPDSPVAQFFWLARAVWSEAFAAGMRREAFDRWMRGPGFVTFSAAAALFLIGLATRGFPMTRFLFHVAQSLRINPSSMGRYDPRWDALLRYGFPIALALVTAGILVATSPISFHRYNARYWLFLILKTTYLMVILAFFWIEGGALLRAHLHFEILRAVVGGLLFAGVFIAIFGWAVLWSFADQRRRCPVCLQLMSMPVSMGSWSSVLDPASTELLCRNGHGTLSISETAMSQPDRWIELDPSWRSLFEEEKASR